jgi:hypothetical protein
MMNGVRLSLLGNRGVELRPHEAVAIVQELIQSGAEVDLVPPFGPLTVDSIVILRDGRVGSSSCAATPAVSEVGRLLESMLPRGRGKVAGGLRYTLARAQLEVDAPPFDSLDALSASLARFESGDRRRVIRSLLARAGGLAPRFVPVTPPRTGGPKRSALRMADRGPKRSALRMADRGPKRSALPMTKRAWRAAAAVVTAFGLGWLAGDRAPSDEARPVSATTVELPAAAPSMPARDALPRSTEMYSPAFSRDGRTIFFHTGGARASRSALMKRNGGDQTAAAIPVVDDGARNYHARPSPDGGRVAYDSDRDGQRAVYIANVDGSNIRRVSRSGYAAVPTWSPDGDRLAFIRAEPGRPKVWNLWLLTDSTGELRRLTRFRYGQTWGASWLPDGRSVVFSHEDRIVRLSLSDGRMRSYPTPVQGRIVRTPAVSPDGHHVVFQVWHDGAWILDLADGAMRRLLADPTAEEFAWSPDGQRFAYHSRADGRWTIRVVPVSDSPA